VSACKAGCEAEAPPYSHICDPCAVRWGKSLECDRSRSIPTDDHGRHDIAFVDFCTRMRLERQNGAKT
jgi:hypothetical protein